MEGETQLTSLVGGLFLNMAKIFFFLCAINVVSSFGKEHSSIFFEEFNLEEGYLKTKR